MNALQKYGSILLNYTLGKLVYYGSRSVLFLWLMEFERENGIQISLESYESATPGNIIGLFVAGIALSIGLSFKANEALSIFSMFLGLLVFEFDLTQASTGFFLVGFGGGAFSVSIIGQLGSTLKYKHAIRIATLAYFLVIVGSSLGVSAFSSLSMEIGYASAVYVPMFLLVMMMVIAMMRKTPVVESDSSHIEKSNSLDADFISTPDENTESNSKPSFLIFLLVALTGLLFWTIFESHSSVLYEARLSIWGDSANAYNAIISVIVAIVISVIAIFSKLSAKRFCYAGIVSHVLAVFLLMLVESAAIPLTDSTYLSVVFCLTTLEFIGSISLFVAVWLFVPRKWISLAYASYSGLSVLIPKYLALLLLMNLE